MTSTSIDPRQTPGVDTATGPGTSDSNGAAPAKTPFNRHRLFPAVVALWFAVLPGLGIMAIGNSTLENTVLALHVDALVPAAAPPLGFTARALVALGLGLAGAVIGFMLARALARPRSQAADTAGAAPASTATEGEDFARLEAARDGLPTRRRALTSQNAAEQAPLDDRLDAIGVIGTVPPVEPSILTLGDLPDLAPPPASTAPAPASTPAPAGDQAPSPAHAADLAQLPLAELVDRFTRALAARGNPPTGPVAAPDEPAPDEPALAEPTPSPVAPARFALAPSDPANDPADPRPFDMPQSLREAGLGNIEWFEDENEEAEVEATLASLLPPKRPRGSALPALDNAPAESGVPDITAETARWTLPELDADDVLGADDSCGSLLDMRPAGRQPAPLAPFVRVEDEAPEGADLPEPVVTFPRQTAPGSVVRLVGNGKATPDAGDSSDEALRDALAVLHRMSGAA